MPEEVLKYRVEIDQGDLASQLTGIKNQIDAAIGSFAFGSAAQAPTMDPLLGQISSFNDQAILGATKFQESIMQSRDLLYGGYETGRVGYQKFTSDLQMAGLISPPGYMEPARSLYSATRDYAPPQIESYGAFRSALAGAFGIGHDADSQISRGEYRRVMQESFGTQIVDSAILGGSILTTLAAAGPLGAPAAVIGTGAFVLNEVIKAGAFEHEAIKNFGSFIERSSFRNMKALTRGESREAAEYIRNLSEDVDFRVAFGDPTDIENTIGGAIAQGTFLDISNLEQFKTRAKETLENFRLIQHTLNATNEEAMQIMGEVTRAGLATGPADISNLISQARTLGDASGFTGKEMLQIASQGAELVRGTGISMSGAGLSAMQLTSMMRTDTFDRDLILQAGGNDQAALIALRTAADFSNMPTGRLMTLARMNGGDINSIGDIFSNAAGAIIDYSPQGILDTMTNMRETRNETDMRLYNLERAKADFLTMEAVGMDNITQANYTTHLINQGMGPTAAGIQAGIAFASPDFYMNTFIKTAQDLEGRYIDEQPAAWQRIIAGISIAGRQAYQSTAGSFFGGIREDLESWGEGLANNMFSDFLTTTGKADAKKANDIAQVLRNLQAGKAGSEYSLQYLLPEGIDIAAFASLRGIEKTKMLTDILEDAEGGVNRITKGLMNRSIVRAGSEYRIVGRDAHREYDYGYNKKIMSALMGGDVGAVYRDDPEKFEEMAAKAFFDSDFLTGPKREAAQEIQKVMNAVIESDAGKLIKYLSSSLASASQIHYFQQGSAFIEEHQEELKDVDSKNVSIATAVGISISALKGNKKELSPGQTEALIERAVQVQLLSKTAESLRGPINLGKALSEIELALNEEKTADKKAAESALASGDMDRANKYYARDNNEQFHVMSGYLGIIANSQTSSPNKGLKMNDGGMPF